MVEAPDLSHGMTRIEVRSTHGERSHLGHVFDDGPGPTPEHCAIASTRLRSGSFPVKDLEREGYGKYLKLFESAETTKGESK